MRKLSYEERVDNFWARIDKRGPFPSKVAIEEFPEIEGTRCWLWLGFITRDGYGHCTFTLYGKKEQRAHRIAWILKRGKKIPKGKCGLHKCDNPACARPSHVYLDTQQENIRDMCRKGRQCKGRARSLTQLGEKGPRAILTEKDVRQIYTLAAFYTSSDIALMYKVSDACIRLVIKGKTWKCVYNKVFKKKRKVIE